MSRIYLPQENLELRDGYIVLLHDYPNVRFLTQMGWRIENNQPVFGWFFVSLLDGAVVPMSSSVVEGIEVVATDGGFPIGVPASACEVLNASAWVSVDTIEDRNALNNAPLANGKVVRVNDVDGEPKMYVWDAINSVWTEMEGGTSNAR